MDNDNDKTKEEEKEKGKEKEMAKKNVKKEAMADVLREYLHITATVVKMKFPQLKYVDSEELINKVKNCQFWEYHDKMIRIMMQEKQRMIAKEREIAQSERKANQKQQTNQSGKLSRFIKMFDGPSSASHDQTSR